MSPLAGHWHKVLALVLHVLGRPEVRITEADLESIVAAYRNEGGATVVVDEHDQELVVRLLSARAAARLVKEHP